MSLESITIQDKLIETFGESVFHFNEEKDVFSFEKIGRASCRERVF